MSLIYLLERELDKTQSKRAQKYGIIFFRLVYNKEQVRANAGERGDAYFSVVYHEEHAVEPLLLENLDARFYKTREHEWSRPSVDTEKNDQGLPEKSTLP